MGRFSVFAGAVAALGAAALLSACASLDAKPDLSPQAVDARLMRLTSPQMETFRSERDFLAYLRALRLEARRNDLWWRGMTPPAPPVAPVPVMVDPSLILNELPSVMPAPPPPPPAPPPPPPPPPPGGAAEAAPSAAEESVVVTGSRIETANTPPESITNVQERGVDEGGIIKRIGRHLIVLMDGRLTAIDVRPNGQPGLALTDRMNVYRSTKQNVWIDEILTFGRRVVVTGYSYALNATEVSIFSLSDDGRFTREGVYYISSGDYYDTENSATRIINDTLVFYTPIDLSEIDPDAPGDWPLIRRWIRDDPATDIPEISDGRRLFDATTLYRPLQAVLEPVAHSISVCPLGQAARGDELDCRTVGVIAGGEREFYVTPDDVYLWTSPGWQDRDRDFERMGCKEALGAFNPARGLPSTLYRIPTNGGDPTALLAQGSPINRTGIAAANGELRALVRQECNDSLAYWRAPLAAFSKTPSRARPGVTTPAPLPGGAILEMRFTEDFLAYTARPERYASPLYSPKADIASLKVIAIPVTAPQAPIVLPAPFAANRLERVGNDFVLTGYSDRTGLQLAALKVTNGAVRLGPVAKLAQRFETEGRSHAFNALVDASGAGVLGIPTAGPGKDARRVPWESEDSDVSFLSIDKNGAIAALGELRAGDTDLVDPSYSCEVSCIDWYGNARPIFTDRRVFALTGAALVEGVIANGGIGETRRVNLTKPLDRSPTPLTPRAP